MADDIKSTKERVAALKNVKKLIDQAIKCSVDAQKYFDVETIPTNYGQWDDMWDGIQARMQLALDASLQASAELALLNNYNGFVFQYEWRVGARGMGSINTDAGADTITFDIDAGDSVENTSNVAVLLADDKLELTGMNETNTQPIVVSAATRVITVNSIITGEANLSGGKVKLIARNA